MLSIHRQAKSQGRFTTRGFFPLIAVVLILLTPMRLLAHPLGNFTVNRYSRLELNTDQVRLTYIVDMAEIPTHQERTEIDADGDGVLSQTEQTAYIARMLATLTPNLHLTLNNSAFTWQAQNQELTFPEGQAGLPTLRLQAEFVAPLPEEKIIWQADFRDDNYIDRIGWQEVIVRADESVKLHQSSAPAQDVTQELHIYPTDLLQSPLAIHQASFRFEPLAVANSTQTQSNKSATTSINTATTSASIGRPADPFAELVKIQDFGPWAILLALLAAFGWGAAHAFSPGHGKTVVAAYLVGSRGTVGHALFLGATTTLTHTAGVFLLGFLTLFAAQFIAPETLYPWLGVISGLLVVAIGLSLAWGRLWGLLGRQAGGHPHDHEHSHEPHDHPHPHEHHHDQHGHSHLPPGADGSPVTWSSLLALGVSGGLLPCPSALVLMLGAISLQRIGFGLALIVVFSLGLASVLTAIGITLVYAGKLFQRIPESGPWVRLLPVASALFITVVGLGITIQALMNIGVLKLV